MMHIRPFFKMSEQQCFELLDVQFFGQLIISIDGQIDQSYLPIIVDKQNKCLYGHLAKQNSLIEAMKKQTKVLVTYLGSNAYISPSWYQSKEQVPTWNYQAVEIVGRVELYGDQETLKIVDELSQVHEAQFDKPWLIGKVPDNKMQSMLKAIVGFRIEILEITGQSKMSQNKNLNDQQGVINGLLAQNETKSQQVAQFMTKGKTNE